MKMKLPAIAYRHYIQKSKELFEHCKTAALELKKRLDSDRIEKNRFLVLCISLLLIFDYMVFCLHADKNIFDIFPSFPVLDSREERTIFLPDTDGRTVLKETRIMAVSDDSDEFVRTLFRAVSKGSMYENTSMAVPLDTFIRKVWFTGDTCIIDLALSSIRTDAQIIEGSENNFRSALEKTICTNISTVKKLIILEKGIPGKALWEIAATED